MGIEAFITIKSLNPSCLAIVFGREQCAIYRLLTLNSEQKLLDDCVS